MSARGVFSVGFRKTLPLPTLVATGPFVFGNTLSVFTCKPGCRPSEVTAIRELTERVIVVSLRAVSL